MKLGKEENSHFLVSYLYLYRLPQADVSDPMTYLAYYKYLLPWKSLYTWLNRTYSAPGSTVSPNASTTSASRNFTHREFAFTLLNDAYLRYNSFSTAEELKREVCRLNPARFEIGPVYSAKVRKRRMQLKSELKLPWAAQRQKDGAKGHIPTRLQRTGI